jgi:endonuclease/exonuclease/phosphatase family metal-dependent hydrolase
MNPTPRTRRPKVLDKDTRQVRIASYNIHRCLGLDGRCDPARTAHVIRELDCDIVGLQEVDSRRGAREDSMQLEYLARMTGMQAIPGATILRHDGDYGNALLTRRPVLAVRRHDFSFRKREPRGALDVDLQLGENRVQVIVTHLGLRPAERRFQVKQLLELLLGCAGDHLIVVLGDINEWLPLSRPLRWLHGLLGRPPSQRTFPVWLPVFALDRVWVRPCDALRELRVHRSPLARTASDHYPIKALIEAGTREEIARKHRRWIKRFSAKLARAEPAPVIVRGGRD